MAQQSLAANEVDAALELLAGLELNASQAARALDVERAVVPTWVNRGVGFPAAVRTAGRQSFYPAAEVARWALERKSLSLDLDRFLLTACLDALENVVGTGVAERLDLLAVLLLVAAHADVDLVGTTPEDMRRRLEDGTPELEQLCAPDLAELTAQHSAREWDVLTRLASILVTHSFTPTHDYLRLRAVTTRRHAGRAEQPLPDDDVGALLTALVPGVRDGTWGPPVVLRGTGLALHWAALATAEIPERTARIVDATDGSGDGCGRQSRGFRRVQVLLDPEALYRVPADDDGAVAGADYLVALPLTDDHTDAEARLADQLGRLDDVLLNAGPGQTVVVLGRRDVLVDPIDRRSAGSRGARLKRELYTGGLVRAALVLGPHRSATASGQSLAVLVLRPPEPPAGRAEREQDPHVLVADLTGHPLTPADPRTPAGRVAHDVATYLSGRPMAQHTQQYGKVVRARTFVHRGLHDAPDQMVRLRAPGDPAALLAEALAAAHGLEELTRPVLPAPLAWPLVAADRDETGRHLPTAARTLGERVTARELRHLPGHRLRAGDVLEAADPAPAQRPVVGAPELLGDRALGSRVVGLDVLAAAYPRVRLTEPGDVLVLDGRDPRVLVDRVGSSVVQSPCAVLRLPRPDRAAARASSSEVFAELLRAALEEQARTGHRTVSWRHARLSESLAFEDAYDDALRRLDALERTLHRHLRSIDDLKRTIRRGVHARILQLETITTTNGRASGQNG